MNNSNNNLDNEQNYQNINQQNFNKNQVTYKQVDKDTIKLNNLNQQNANNQIKSIEKKFSFNFKSQSPQQKSYSINQNTSSQRIQSPRRLISPVSPLNKNEKISLSLQNLNKNKIQIVKSPRILKKNSQSPLPPLQKQINNIQQQNNNCYNNSNLNSSVVSIKTVSQSVMLKDQKLESLYKNQKIFASAQHLFDNNSQGNSKIRIYQILNFLTLLGDEIGVLNVRIALENIVNELEDFLYIRSEGIFEKIQKIIQKNICIKDLIAKDAVSVLVQEFEDYNNQEINQKKKLEKDIELLKLQLENLDKSNLNINNDEKSISLIKETNNNNTKNEDKTQNNINQNNDNQFLLQTQQMNEIQSNKTYKKLENDNENQLLLDCKDDSMIGGTDTQLQELMKDLEISKQKILELEDKYITSLFQLEEKNKAYEELKQRLAKNPYQINKINLKTINCRDICEKCIKKVEDMQEQYQNSIKLYETDRQELEKLRKILKLNRQTNRIQRSPMFQSSRNRNLEQQWTANVCTANQQNTNKDLYNSGIGPIKQQNTQQSIISRNSSFGSFIDQYGNNQNQVNNNNTNKMNISITTNESQVSQSREYQIIKLNN